MLYNMYPVDRSGGDANVTTEAPAPMSNVNAALRYVLVFDQNSDTNRVLL